MPYRAYRVKVDRRLCGDPMSCRSCLDGCPQSVFTAYPRGGRRRRDSKSQWVVYPGFGAICDGCGLCRDFCPRNAISVAARARA